MSIHELKTDSEVFEAVLRGEKTYEIRKDDRGFNVGDELRLRETASTGAQMKCYGFPLEYTGREVTKTVSHILRGPIYGLAEGWAILSFTLAELAARDASMIKQGHEESAVKADELAEDAEHKMMLKTASYLIKLGKTIRALSPAVPAMEEIRRKVLEEAAIWWAENGVGMPMDRKQRANLFRKTYGLNMTNGEPFPVEPIPPPRLKNDNPRA